MRFLERGTTDSTMLDARRAIGRGPLRELTVFTAAEQTGGVGRMGRAWSSPKGGLWMTAAMPVEADHLPAMAEGLGLRVGVAALDVVERACRDLAAGMGGSDSGPSRRSPMVRLKWPNDVLLNGKKVAGVLVEVVREGGGAHVLIGVGVNANFSTRDLPEDVRGRATTMLAELGTAASLEELRDAMARAVFLAASRRGLPRETLERARGALAGVGEPVRIAVGAAVIEGTLLGLSDRGLPLVMTEDGEVEAAAGSEIGW